METVIYDGSSSLCKVWEQRREKLQIDAVKRTRIGCGAWFVFNSLFQQALHNPDISILSHMDMFNIACTSIDFFVIFIPILAFCIEDVENFERKNEYPPWAMYKRCISMSEFVRLILEFRARNRIVRHPKWSEVGKMDKITSQKLLSKNYQIMQEKNNKLDDAIISVLSMSDIARNAFAKHSLRENGISFETRCKFAVSQMQYPSMVAMKIPTEIMKDWAYAPLFQKYDFEYVESYFDGKYLGDSQSVSDRIKYYKNIVASLIDVIRVYHKKYFEHGKYANMQRCDNILYSMHRINLQMVFILEHDILMGLASVIPDDSFNKYVQKLFNNSLVLREVTESGNGEMSAIKYWTGFVDLRGKARNIQVVNHIKDKYLRTGIFDAK